MLHLPNKANWTVLAIIMFIVSGRQKVKILSPIVDIVNPSNLSHLNFLMTVKCV